MTTQLGRRALAGAAALLPAAAMIGAAQAQSANETTFDRVRRTKTLRIAALPGELPYFQKDITIGEWSGACIDMAKDIAKVFDAQLGYVEVHLRQLGARSAVQQGRSRLRAEPDAAARAVDRLHPPDDHPSVRLRRAQGPRSEDLGRHQQAGRSGSSTTSARCTRRRRSVTVPRRSSPATRRATSARWRCNRAVPMCTSWRRSSGLSAIGKNPSLGSYHLLTDPLVALPSCLGIQREPDHAVCRRDQRLDRLQPRHRPDPRMAARRAGEVRCDARADSRDAELLTRREERAMVYHWDFAFLLRYMPLFWKGVLVTLAYTAGTIFLGLIIGLLIGLGRLSRSKLVNIPLIALHRGVPLHAAAGADRLVLLRAAGAAEHPDPRHRRGGDGAVAATPARSMRRSSAAASSRSSRASGTRRVRSGCGAGR